MPIGKVVAKGQSSFAIVANQSALSIYTKELLEMNKDLEEQKTNNGNFQIKCRNGIVQIHREMASLLSQLPQVTNISREAMLITVRILYGELVDNDVIGWLQNLKYEESQLRQHFEEIYSIGSFLGNPFKSSIEILRGHIDLSASKLVRTDQVLHFKFKERFNINSKCSSADQEPFEYSPNGVVWQPEKVESESDEEMSD